MRRLSRTFPPSSSASRGKKVRNHQAPAISSIIAKHMNKKQQMRWNRATVQPFLDVRTAVLNDTL
jgi:hypothetical protein